VPVRFSITQDQVQASPTSLASGSRHVHYEQSRHSRDVTFFNIIGAVAFCPSAKNSRQPGTPTRGQNDSDWRNERVL